MPRLGEPIGNGTTENRSPRRVGRPAVMLAVALLGLVGAVDFAEFIRQVTKAAPQPSASADAIVVLTGGADRIKDAAELLGKGRASRLLISGVHPNTSISAIARTAPIDSTLLSCCVDIDRLSANTIENARQTKLWAERMNFASLIVVTSAYHMPRSMAELGNVMPRVALVPYPVVRQDLDLSRWYVKPSTIRLMTAEYVKYLVARFRMRLEAPPADDTRVAGAL